MKTGSLFSGIGGLDLGLERAGLHTTWFAESDPFASRVLAHHWPDTPNHGNMTKIDWTTVEPVDLLHGGFPCQDISEAGKGAGILKGNRSGLWYEFVRAIRVLRPSIVVVENVSALLARGLDIVLGDLAECGFDASWTSLRASDVGAPHVRERIFIVAAVPDLGVPRLERVSDADPPGRTEPSDGGAGAGQWGDYWPAIRRWELDTGTVAPSPVDDRGRLSVEFACWLMGFPEGWVDGLSRSRALQVLGNAVVPHCAEVVGGWVRQVAGKEIAA